MRGKERKRRRALDPNFDASPIRENLRLDGEPPLVEKDFIGKMTEIKRLASLLYRTGRLSCRDRRKLGFSKNELLGINKKEN